MESGREHTPCTESASLDRGLDDLDAALRALEALGHDHRMLQAALESLPDGLAIYDGRDRLKFRNQAYLDCFPTISGRLAPGVEFDEVIRLIAGAGLVRGAESEDWLAARAARHRAPEGAFEQHLADGRRLLVRERRLGNGWSVGHYVDVTALRASQADVDRARDALDRQVHERTEELRRANERLHAEVAERQALEERLRGSERRLRGAIDNIGEGIALYDDDDRLVVSSRFYREFLGPPVGDMLVPGVSFREICEASWDAGLPVDTKMSREEWIEWRVREHLAVGNVLERELPGDRWLKITNRSTAEGCIVSVASDITALKRKERELEESEHRFRDLAEGSVLGMFIHQSFDLVFANQALADLLGYRSPDEVLARGTILDLIARHEHERVREYARRRREGRDAPPRYEMDMLRHDGTLVPVENTVRVVHWAGVPSYQGFVVDISERRRAETVMTRYRQDLEDDVKRRTRELEKAQGEALRNERLATLGRLTATVGHELRTPLGTIRSSVALLREHIDVHGEDEGRILERVDRNIARCDRIIEELLMYTRLGHAERTAVDIDGWLREVVQEFDVPAGIEVELELASGTTATIDRERLQRALMNLMANACHAMDPPHAPPGGRRLVIASRRTPDKVELLVKDRGTGIPETDHDKVFEPLFSTKSFGIGLGLPLVRQVAEMHAGGVEIDATGPQGTTMVLWLPAAPQPGTAA